MNELDKHITKFNKHRKIEKKGRTIGIVLVGGETIIGKLIRHEANKFFIRDWKDYDIEKEIHRATIVRFMVIAGGEDGTTT